jgi:peptidoglycan/xylan/chitin deacetylase (PgdA/CDA1 family)
MSWDELRELSERGWEIGSHTRSHPWLPALDGPSLRDELEGSKEISESQMGITCESLAYPYGATDARVMQAARESGYLVAATLPRRQHAPLPLRWPRVGVYNGNDGWIFRLKVSPPLRRLSGVVR